MSSKSIELSEVAQAISFADILHRGYKAPANAVVEYLKARLVDRDVDRTISIADYYMRKKESSTNGNADRE